MYIILYNILSNKIRSHLKQRKVHGWRHERLLVNYVFQQLTTIITILFQYRVLKRIQLFKI